MKVLSLFDGMSCGMIALERAGINVDTYYASEIDKYAIEISKKNYPQIVQVGDVCDLDPKDFKDVGLIIGGSPCQGFSFAGKQLAFDDPRSALFFEFVRLLEAIKPRYFLLENVRMKKEYLQVITDILGVEPIFINSALVSAQNRRRYYWTNIPNIKDPEDRNIILKDILESDAVEPILSNIYGGFKEKKPREHFDKSVTIRTASGGGHIPSVYIKSHVLKAQYYKSSIANFTANNGFRATGVWTKDNIRKLTPVECERLQTVPDNYTEGVSNTQRYKMLGNGWTVEVIKHILGNMA